MPSKTVHCSICGESIKGKDFGERMRKLRRHRKAEHPKAHKKSVKKTLKTKRARGIIDKHPRKKKGLKQRTRLVSTPQVQGYEDLPVSGLIRVLFRADNTDFPEFAFYPSKRAFAKVNPSLVDAGFKEEERGKWVLRSNKFSIFVYG